LTATEATKSDINFNQEINIIIKNHSKYTRSDNTNLTLQFEKNIYKIKEIMEFRKESTLSTLSVSQSPLEVVMVDHLPLSEHSLDVGNETLRNKTISGKLSSPVLHHDPSCSGELDPYTVIILSQL